MGNIKSVFSLFKTQFLSFFSSSENLEKVTYVILIPSPSNEVLDFNSDVSGAASSIYDCFTNMQSLVPTKKKNTEVTNKITSSVKIVGLFHLLNIFRY